MDMREIIIRWLSKKEKLRNNGEFILFFGFLIVIFIYIIWLLYIMSQHSNEQNYITTAIVAIPNLLVAVVTFLYVLLTRDLVKTNQELVNAQNRPIVIAYVKISERDIHFADLIIENVGLGVARNIHFIVEPANIPTINEDIPLDRNSFIQKGLPVLGPKEKFRAELWYLPMLFDEVRINKKSPEILQFQIIISYQNSVNENMKAERCNIDLGIFWDL
jgi:hypothetical protein